MKTSSVMRPHQSAAHRTTGWADQDEIVYRLPTPDGHRPPISITDDTAPVWIIGPTPLKSTAVASGLDSENEVDYRVELDIFHGPMDLLLYLIKRDEVDIYDIPIASITDSYMNYVNVLRGVQNQPGLDINVAGEFLVMAATLMEIKSAMLLPRAPAATDGKTNTAAAELTDPRAELVQQLLDYKRFRDSARLLEERQIEHANRFARYPAKREGNPDEPAPLDMDEVQVWDLLSAFDRLMKEVAPRKPRYHEVTYDDTPIDLHAADIEDRIRREGKLTLRALIVGRKSRSEMIGVFLALLELIRQKKVLVNQPEEGGELEIDRAPDEHRKAHTEPPEPVAGNQGLSILEIKGGHPTAPQKEPRA